MPHHKSCAKRLRQAAKANERNRFYRATLRTLTKKVRVATEKDVAEKALVEVISALDKLVKRGLVHKNKAANQKSKLTKLVNSL